VPFEVEVEAGVVGGPSAGLLFGIAIVEQLTSEQLIGPVTVSGTGTLSADGSVGAVGGIRQKLFQAGSRDSDVAVFLLPQANLGELRHVTVERDLVVVPVATLQQALDALGAVARGETPNGAVTLRA